MILGFSGIGIGGTRSLTVFMNAMSQRQHFLCRQRFSSSLDGNQPNHYPFAFCEWLAGVIDGDGSLCLDKGRYPQLIITMGSEDVPLLEYVKGELGTGGIIEVNGAKANRYRICNRLGIMKVIKCINGNIRNSVREPQLRRVCDVLGIPFREPIELTERSHWFAGFFDSDGSIGMYAPPKQAPQLRISVTNKHRTDLEAFKEVFEGNINFDKSGFGFFQWVVSSRKDVLRFLKYYKESAFQSCKSRRFNLISEYFQLKDSHAYRPDSPHYDDWLDFQNRWKNFIC